MDYKELIKCLIDKCNDCEKLKIIYTFIKKYLS
jgi:hypothetical protein